jgi:hypothetical protein
MNKNNYPEPNWNDGRVPVNRLIETNSDKNHDYYGRFETYQDGGCRSFQTWIANGDSVLSSQIVDRKVNEIEADPWLSHQLETFLFDGSHVYRVDIEKGDVSNLKGYVRETGMHYAPENSKNEYIHKLNVSYSPNVFKSSIVVNDNDFQLDLVKENQELRERLAEIQRKLIGVLDELKNCKNDKLISELTEVQEKNQRLIKESEVPISLIKGQVQKSETLLQRVGNCSSTSPFKGENSGKFSLPTKIGIGGAIVSFVLVIGFFIYKKRLFSK